jgi:hypothetical protein
LLQSPPDCRHEKDKAAQARERKREREREREKERQDDGRYIEKKKERESPHQFWRLHILAIKHLMLGLAQSADLQPTLILDKWVRACRVGITKIRRIQSRNIMCVMFTKSLFIPKITQ